MGWWSRIAAPFELTWSVPQRRLMRERANYHLTDFVQHFGRDADIAEEVWSALSDEAVIPGFRPKPEDDLRKVFGLAEEDLDDVVLSILARCRCRVPPPSETGRMNPLRTVADLFEFVAGVRASDRRERPDQPLR